MKMWLKRIICVVVFIGLLSGALFGFHSVFSFKYGDGIYSLKTFYQLEKDSTDVVVVGSSHAFENINPMILWQDEGITAFDLCGSIAPLWNSYYYLKEAFKTQSPKLVILEPYCLTKDVTYMDDSRIIKNVFGMKPSPDKWEALKVSAPKDRWAEFGLSYIQYHNRYKEISSEDCLPYMGNEAFFGPWKGFGNNFEVNPFPMPSFINSGERSAIPDKQHEYYEKILKLCQEKNIPLLVAVAPYAGYTASDMAVYNSAADMAASYNVPFVNFNEHYQQIGFDWSTDFADVEHMSYLGNAKFSHYLADYLSQRYELPNHLQDSDGKYQSWAQASRYYNNSLTNNSLSKIATVDAYAAALQTLSPDYTVILTQRGAMPAGAEALSAVLQSKGIPVAAQPDNAWVWDTSGAQTVSNTSYNYYWSQQVGGKELLVAKEGIYFFGTNFEKNPAGVNLVVFDRNNETVADSVWINETVLGR